MSPDPRPAFGDLRVGDRERAQAAERLSAHHAAGRLTLEELEERQERVQSAVFAADLQAVEADLPSSARRRRPAPRPPAAALALLALAIVATVLVGHPIPPLFFLAALVWFTSRRRFGPPIRRSA
jgi:ferric-dicitrate binding protein FerR (iron transport regulator)